jgi:hypothetical protein
MIYGGSLDDTSRFRPTIAILNYDRFNRAMLPPGLAVIEAMPD